MKRLIWLIVACLSSIPVKACLDVAVILTDEEALLLNKQREEEAIARAEEAAEARALQLPKIEEQMPEEPEKDEHD